MKIGFRCLCVALLALGGQSANAAFDVSINDVSAQPGTSATMTVRVAGGMNFTAFNVAFGVDPVAGNSSTANAPLVSTAATGILSVWDAAKVASPGAATTSSPAPSTPIPGTDVVVNTAIDGGVAMGNGIVLQANFAVPASAQVGDMFLVDINERGFTSAGITMGGTFTDLTNMLNFLNAGGNGIGIGKITVVPEPSSFILLGLIGGVGVAGNWVRKKFRSEV